MRQNRMGGQMKRKSETCVDLRVRPGLTAQASVNTIEASR